MKYYQHIAFQLIFSICGISLVPKALAATISVSGGFTLGSSAQQGTPQVSASYTVIFETITNDHFALGTITAFNGFTLNATSFDSTNVEIIYVTDFRGELTRMAIGGQPAADMQGSVDDFVIDYIFLDTQLPPIASTVLVSTGQGAFPVDLLSSSVQIEIIPEPSVCVHLLFGVFLLVGYRQRHN